VGTKTVVLISLVLLLALVGCQQKEKEQSLSAEDLFDLRSKCKGLADKWEKVQEAMGDYPIVSSHYDVKTNRCLVKADTPRPGAGGSEVTLTDAQSDVVLASCTYVETKTYCTIHGVKDLPEEHVLSQIDKMMGHDSR
jgi:hypothetical protein